MLASRPPRHPVLAGLIDSVWVHAGVVGHAHEVILPTGRAQILFDLSNDFLAESSFDGVRTRRVGSAALHGPRTQPVVVATAHQRRCCGISFTYAGAACLGVPAFELADDFIGLDALWPTAHQIHEQLMAAASEPTLLLDVLERALVARLVHVALDPRAVLACLRLSSGASCRSVAGELSLSPRRLTEIMRAQVGLAPKVFARVVRFQHAARALAAGVPAIEVALAHGYADQAHLVREYRAFAGTTPGRAEPRREAPSHLVLRA